jgi:class 3 adenylate cyclase
MDYAEGRVSRRRLLQQLERLRVSLDSAALSRLVDGVVADIKRPGMADVSPYLNRYLIDFLTLRRDLKLAYLAFEAMDGIRILQDDEDVRLSRSNGTLIEFNWRDEPTPLPRRIRGHTVIKADVRGSTSITEQLRERGLNPASHFSLNFFDPVNRLLGEFGAEKLFVEGDAVILVIFEYEEDGAGLSVARACGLARKILQVVALQNAHNARHDLPQLELGLGIAYSRREPNFLFDEGRRIMISGAINLADRLSACSSGLRSHGFRPESEAFRVSVVSDLRAAQRQADDGDLKSYNVNGVKIDQDAFFKLQRELRLRPVRLPDDELGDTLFFAGFYPDLAGRGHWLVLRYGPVRGWDGSRLGEVDPRRRHFFEVIVDEDLTARVRRLAREEAG